MGHDDRERRRLFLQASILNPLSNQLLKRAGVSAGFRVLDIGCGIGELSMVAARLVRSVLFEFAPDPVAFAVAPAALAISGLIPCYLAAQKAARTNVALALQAE